MPSARVVPGAAFVSAVQSARAPITRRYVRSRSSVRLCVLPANAQDALCAARIWSMGPRPAPIATRRGSRLLAATRMDLPAVSSSSIRPSTSTRQHHADKRPDRLWTNEQIITAIREGKDKEGEHHLPAHAVPPTTTCRRRREGDRRLPAYAEADPQRGAAIQVEHPATGDAAGEGAPAPPYRQVAYGRYIVTAIAHCFECHTTPDPNGRPTSSMISAPAGSISRSLLACGQHVQHYLRSTDRHRYGAMTTSREL